MSAQNGWIAEGIREVLTYVCPFVPRQEWFSHQEDAKVWVSAYRVYRAPSESVSLRRSLTADFQRVRAVFLRWDAPYIKPDQNVIEQKNGQLTLELHPFHMYRTGEGVLLLLITPLPDGYDASDESAARERVSVVRSVMVALMGRNAAYEYEFDLAIECDTRTVGPFSPVFTTPVDETPAVNREGVELVRVALERLSSLDDSTQNRIRLALRWYQRSFGDDRLVRDTQEEDVDKFINCWLAWETLVMERYNDINSITRALAAIHGLERQQIGELFPIGRIYHLRGRILHHGQIEDLEQGLIRFMTDVFSDLLLRVLDLPIGQNTKRYLDGSARELA